MLRPLPQTIHQGQIENIQDQFAHIVLERETESIQMANKIVPGDQVVSDEEIKQTEKRQAEITKRVADRKSQEKTAGAQRRGDGQPVMSPTGQVDADGSGSLTSKQAMKQQVTQQVANQGLLGVLSSTSKNAQGQVAGSILGDNGSQTQNQIFDNLNKIQTPGGGGGRSDGSAGSSAIVRGQRTTTGGKIDGIISELGSTSTQDLHRSSDFAVSRLSPLSESGEVGTEGNVAVSSGARDLDQVSSTVLAHSSAVQYCYERELKRNPDLKGKVVVRFTILPNGTVSNPKILSSTLNNPNVERCILSRISRWDDFGSIDPSLGNSTFRQVYTFGF